MDFTTPSPLTRAAALLGVVIVGGLFYLGGKVIETRDRQPTTISVSGEGRVFVAPDTAELTFGMQTGRRPSVKETMATLKQNMDSVIAAAKKTGVQEKDISTEQFYLNPAYDWINGAQVSRGYEAQETLRVKVRDLDKVGDVLTAATSAGANQAGNVVFTTDDPEQGRVQAREKAIAQAKEKAQKLAADLGMRLGRIKGFQEGGEAPSPMPFARADAAVGMGGGGGGGPIPMPSGQQEVSQQVVVTYELR